MPVLAHVRVDSVERLSPSFVRIGLAGPDLADLGTDGPTYDQRIKLLFPPRSGVLPALDPSTWYADLRALPEPDRPPVRTYTIRALRGEGIEKRLYVDLVLHPGAHGPGSDWAAAARPGDEICVCGPKLGESWGGIEWAPGSATQLLLVGDETAVPAVASILGSLPASASGAAFLEVPVAGDVQDLPAPTGIDVRWLPRGTAPVGHRVIPAVGSLLGFGAPRLAADAAPDLWETPRYSSSGEPVEERPPADGRYAWIAGESRMVTTLRRHLVDDLGLPRSQVAFMGYWRQGVAMRG